MPKNEIKILASKYYALHVPTCSVIVDRTFDRAGDAVDWAREHLGRESTWRRGHELKTSLYHPWQPRTYRQWREKVLAITSAYTGIPAGALEAGAIQDLAAAASLLLEAYQRGEEDGGHIDWENVDVAWERAVVAGGKLGWEQPVRSQEAGG